MYCIACPGSMSELVVVDHLRGLRWRRRFNATSLGSGVAPNAAARALLADVGSSTWCLRMAINPPFTLRSFALVHC